MMAEGQFPRIFKIGTKALDKFKRKFYCALKWYFMQLKQSKIWLLLNIILDSHICMIQYLLSVLAELEKSAEIQ